MGQGGTPTASGSQREIQALLTSPGLLAGAAILFVSALMGASGTPGAALAVGIIGYVVAGALAPPYPFLTGILLALIHGAMALAFDQLAERAPPGDGLAAIGASMFIMVYAGSIVLGALVTGVVGHLVGWLKTRGR